MTGRTDQSPQDLADPHPLTGGTFLNRRNLHRAIAAAVALAAMSPLFR